MVSLCAHEVPNPVMLVDFLSLEDSTSSMGTQAPVAKGFCQGETMVTASKLNRNALQLDLVGRYGGGGHGIAHGLELGLGEGLSVVVHPGHAMLDGVVEISKPLVVKVSPSQNRVYLWLLQDGSIWQSEDIEAVPEIACCYLGSYIASEGVIISVDLSGVMYFRGGSLWRETADLGAPLDQPRCSFPFFHKTVGGTYYWDGGRYLEMLPVGSPRWVTVKKHITDLGSGTIKMEVLTLPPGSVVQSVGILGRCRSHFVSVGIEGFPDLFLESVDLPDGEGTLENLKSPRYFECEAKVTIQLVPKDSSITSEDTELNLWLLHGLLS